MTKLPVVSGRECIDALQRAGFYKSRQKGSHVTMRRDDPYAKPIVPLHKTLKPGTLKSILRQAELSIEGFIELLN